jgi:hypothetical protein
MGNSGVVSAYLGVFMRKAFKQVVFHDRRAIVECWEDIRRRHTHMVRPDLPLSGFGFHSPANGLLLDSMFEKARLARWFVMMPSRDCTGLANIEKRAAVDSS